MRRDDVSQLRITPACAGKTDCDIRASLAYRDHPRVCGENLAVLVLSAAEKGSPPRVRGKPLRSAVATSSTGITPACAGKTGTEPKLEAVTEDHPRVCGENAICQKDIC